MGTQGPRTLSIWQQRSFGATPDVVVIGAGLVGLFTALHHKRKHPEQRVVVLERGPYPDGASVRNAGFSCFGSPSEILADMAAEGADAALARVAERWIGSQELRQEMGDAALGYIPTGGYEVYNAHDTIYTRTAERFDQLNAELRGICGQAPFIWADERVADLGLRADHLAFTPLEGQVDSGLFIQQLLAKVRAAGVHVLMRCEVGALEERSDGILIQLTDDEPLLARRVVLATNGYVRQLIPSVDVVPARGQVLITAPIPGLRLRGTFHAEEGFFYFRNVEDRVLLGGGRHLDKAGETTWLDATTLPIQRALEQFLTEVVLPGVEHTIEHRWSGVMGFRAEGKDALVEKVGERIVVAAGLSGIGVAIGIRVAARAAALLQD